jgi:hypothetical protein
VKSLTRITLTLDVGDRRVPITIDVHGEQGDDHQVTNLAYAVFGILPKVWFAGCPVVEPPKIDLSLGKAACCE